MQLTHLCVAQCFRYKLILGNLHCNYGIDFTLFLFKSILEPFFSSPSDSTSHLFRCSHSYTLHDHQSSFRNENEGSPSYLLVEKRQRFIWVNLKNELMNKIIRFHSNLCVDFSSNSFHNGFIIVSKNLKLSV